MTPSPKNRQAPAMPTSASARAHPGARGDALRQRHQRQDAALAAVVGAHDQRHVFDRHDQHQRPEDQRQDAQDLRRVIGTSAKSARLALKRVERAGADVAIDDAQAPRQRTRWRSRWSPPQSARTVSSARDMRRQHGDHCTPQFAAGTPRPGGGRLRRRAPMQRQRASSSDRHTARPARPRGRWGCGRTRSPRRRCAPAQESTRASAASAARSPGPASRGPGSSWPASGRTPRRARADPPASRGMFGLSMKP